MHGRHGRVNGMMDVTWSDRRLLSGRKGLDGVAPPVIGQTFGLWRTWDGGQSRSGLWTVGWIDGMAALGAQRLTEEAGGGVARRGWTCVSWCMHEQCM